MIGRLEATDEISEWVDGWLAGWLDKYGVEAMCVAIDAVFVLSYLGLALSASLVLVWVVATAGKWIKSKFPSEQLKDLSKDISNINRRIGRIGSVSRVGVDVVERGDYVMRRLEEVCGIEGLPPLDCADFLKAIEEPARKGDVKRVRDVRRMWANMRR